MGLLRKSLPVSSVARTNTQEQQCRAPVRIHISRNNHTEHWTHVDIYVALCVYYLQHLYVVYKVFYAYYGVDPIPLSWRWITWADHLTCVPLCTHLFREKWSCERIDFTEESSSAWKKVTYGRGVEISKIASNQWRDMIRWGTNKNPGSLTFHEIRSLFNDGVLISWFMK